MADGIIISEGGMADLEAVMQVMGDSFDPAYGEAWTSAQCAGLMPMPGVWLSLARSGDDVIGFALGRIVLKEAELLLLAVRQDGQRKGIGRMLLDRFILVAASRGADRLHLEVRAGNPAMNLYLKAGFAEVGRRKNYYTGSDGQIYDALTLTRASTI